MCSLLAPCLGICQRQLVPFLAHFCRTAGEHFGAYQTDCEHPWFLVLWPLWLSINIPLGRQKQQSDSLGYLCNCERLFPERSLGSLPFVFSLGLFICAALNAGIWDTLLVIQRAQVFLLSSIPVVILLSIPPGLLQSHSQIDICPYH